MITRIEKRNRSLKIDRLIGLMAMGLIILAWYAGGLRSTSDVMPVLEKLFPKAQQFQLLEHDTYAAWSDEAGSRLIGYIRVSKAMGYGGPMTVAVASNTRAEIIGISIMEHKDTPTYFERVLKSGLIKNLIGKSYKNELYMGYDIDGVSGATKSSYPIVETSRLAIRAIAHSQLGMELPNERERTLKFGKTETILLVLFALGILARRKGFKHTRTVRWFCLLVALVAFGFMYDSSFTIVMVNQFLLGFWPDWHTNLYTYLLVGGILLLFVIEGKNPYCRWICPFGSAQECISKITNAKVRSSKKYRTFLKWLHRGMALAAILLALLFRTPGLTSYEVFGALFQMWGSAYQFIVIAMVLFMSLYTLRPWCNYLCPVRPVEDYLRMIKKWLENIWPKNKKEQKT